jgi:NAD(P)H-hydrate repair Nnr-like enzyme with NAD(P)H-hydrate epimerase domain
VVDVEVTVDVMTVDVVVDAIAGFGASCFWHPMTAKTVETAASAMITEIFFMILHLLSFREHNRNAFVVLR